MLLRLDPVREFDRLADQMFGGQRAPRLVPMDAYRSGEHFVFHFDLPGVDPSSIDVNVHRNVLSIAALRPARSTDEVQVLLAERPSGEFSRQLMLGDGLNVEGITATYDNGVLTVTIPVAETAKPRKIVVGPPGATDRRVIETTNEKVTVDG